MADNRPFIGPKACGCAIILLIIGVVGIFLPLFGIQFKLISSFAESFGLPDFLAAIILVAIAILIGIVGFILNIAETSDSHKSKKSMDVRVDENKTHTITSIFFDWNSQGQVSTSRI